MEPRVLVKSDVLLYPEHFYQYHTGLILKAFSEAWPIKSLPIMITRGAEDVPTGARLSKHLICKAFDFRARNLPGDVDRNLIIKRALEILGPDYWGYYKKTDITEWFHIQWNR